jgi:pyruvate kinase
MKTPASYRRRTKIVCTIGPATGTPAMIAALVRAGMNVARLNLTHGTQKTHSAYAKIIRETSARLDMKVAILMDIPGPKYRIGRLKDSRVTLKRGSLLTLTTQGIEGDASMLPVNLPTIAQDIKVGDNVLLDDGAMQLRVLSKNEREIRCRVVVGGILNERRGLAVPGMHDSAPFLTDSLREHLQFAISEKPDYLAISFVSSADDVSAVRSIMKDHSAAIPIVSKIERGEAVRRFDSILAASDAIMVARGDLGVDIPLERVPLVQKDIIRKCNRAGKTVITATQMLESMISAALPTRAEVTDVANAILDGTDATMLSGETAVGKHPLAACRMMARVAEETEKRLSFEQLMAEREAWLERETDELIAYSACHTARTLGAAAIVAFTQSGSTARRVSKYRPGVPIIAITQSDAVCGELLLYWGVYPVRIAPARTVADLFSAGAALVKKLGLAVPGDRILITGGVPVGIAGTTNLLKVEEIR